MSTLKAAVIGHPISHSKSPRLHNAAYHWLGLQIDYRAIDLAPSELAGFIAELRAEPGWLGLSVTMPHKAAIRAQMDELDQLAAALGVLNTVRVTSEGALKGSNTDVIGIVKALNHAGYRGQASGAPAPVVLGGGGTALAVLAALGQLGATAVELYLRDPGKAEALTPVAESLGVQLRTRPLTSVSEARPELLISTLPPHGADQLAPAISPVPGGYLLDVVYDPWPSELARRWQLGGGTVVSGLEMLLYQAVEQVEIFTDSVIQDRTGLVNVMCDSIGLPRR